MRSLATVVWGVLACLVFASSGVRSQAYQAQFSFWTSVDGSCTGRQGEETTTNSNFCPFDDQYQWFLGMTNIRIYGIQPDCERNGELVLFTTNDTCALTSGFRVTNACLRFRVGALPLSDQEWTCSSFTTPPTSLRPSKRPTSSAPSIPTSSFPTLSPSESPTIFK